MFKDRARAGHPQAKPHPPRFLLAVSGEQPHGPELEIGAVSSLP